ncbi:Peptidoglycan/LPS O-acetylase OafA/YrhL, contains acyltransferase and SGNH-hydrolase domains [Pseudobutyrivibrio sp. 49]|uniref:acyltransferase family protein n=1 Tax=Pseudobutyrivibrio sp. 49 TaxID=1855344 RepID=UPI000889A718|nr:acyltransferase [Pseudobutyrivibrio sp. 49]SDI26189.1 Peptidoglycan/LPS O-acetylase OafA/YrhL, contains acyltransferase and SGNH-hydrolase domains [Pseudobutyrivibrio sp. 49]
MKKRIIGLDILRDIGVIFIFFYHFFVEYIVTAQGTDGAMYGYNYFFNILARPASLFLFVISGYALMYNHEDELPLGKYYLRRFKGLFIPFYVAYTIMFVVCFLVDNQVVGHDLPISRFIFTILGVDGVAQLIKADFYLIGEWFMSCIVVCYALFPLLAKLLKKFKFITLGVLLVWYVIALLVYNPFPFTQLMNPLFIIVYFYLGMLLQVQLGDEKINSKLRIVCAILSALIFIYFCLIGFVPSFEWMKLTQEQNEIIYFAISMTMLVALRDVEISSEKSVYTIITYISGISWYVILLHHRIMILFYSHLSVEAYNHREIFALLLACIFITWSASILVRNLSSRVKKIFK